MRAFKGHPFRVAVQWLGGRSLRLGGRGKQTLRVADFKGAPGTWSAEELLVGSLAACYELTLIAIADREQVPLHTVEIYAEGDVQRLRRGGYAFRSLELDVKLATDRGRELDAEEVAVIARREFVGRALDVPVHLRRVEARAASAAA